MLLATPTSESAKQEIEDIKKNVEIMEKKLATLRDSVEVLSAGDKKTFLDLHDKYFREYRYLSFLSTNMIFILINHTLALFR